MTTKRIESTEQLVPLGRTIGQLVWCRVFQRCRKLVMTARFSLRFFRRAPFITTVFIALLTACGGSSSPANAPPQQPPVLAPTIVDQPLAATVDVGASASFSVSASGTAPLLYQWRRGGVNIPGANAPTYTLAAATSADDGAQFSVLVSNSAGSVTSDAAALTVRPAATAPSIVVAPQDVSVAVGQTATFAVTAGGTAPLQYEWLRDGVVIPSATNATYTTGVLAIADNGARFSVTVRNSAGQVTSAQATLTVANAPGPIITAQPQSLTVVERQAATFSVSVDGGAPATYQWLRNGAPIAGATTSTLTLTEPLRLDDGARFSVNVSRAGGVSSSSEATLTVVWVQAVTAGQNTSMAIANDGTVWEWGSGLNNSSGARRLVPTLVRRSDGSLFEEGAVVSSGFGHALARDGDGRVRAWGDNSFGQLGRGFSGGTYVDPDLVRLPDLTPLSGIADVQTPRTGALSVALASDGTLWTWGSNVLLGVGSIGTGLTSNPVRVLQSQGGPTFGQTASVSSGFEAVVVRRTDGTVWIWGGSVFAGTALGGDTALVSRAYNPVQVFTAPGQPVSDALAVAAGYYYQAILRSDGTVLTWGVNSRGQLGNTTTLPRERPGPLVDSSGNAFGNVVALAAGDTTLLLLRADGTVWAVGDNASGQLGDGRSTATSTVPVQVLEVGGQPLTGVTAISMRADTALALKQDGTVWSWGSDFWSQMRATGHTGNSNVARPVAGLVR